MESARIEVELAREWLGRVVAAIEEMGRAWVDAL